MTEPKKKSDTTKTAMTAHAGWGRFKKEHLSYAFVWFAGLAIGAWLF